MTGRKPAQENRLRFFNDVVYEAFPTAYNARDRLTFGAWWQLVRRALGIDVQKPIRFFAETRSDIIDTRIGFVANYLQHGLAAFPTLTPDMLEHEEAFAQQPAQTSFVEPSWEAKEQLENASRRLRNGYLLWHAMHSHFLCVLRSVRNSDKFYHLRIGSYVGVAAR